MQWLKVIQEIIALLIQLFPPHKVGGTGSGNVLSVQVFTTPGSTTYTPTAGTSFVQVECVGGGGGGAGVPSPGAGNVCVAGAGGGGGYVRKIYLTGFNGGTVTVGAGGAGGAAGQNDGITGAASGFVPASGTTITGGAGSQGSSVAAGVPPFLPGSSGAGGNALNGDVNRPGTAGGSGLGQATTSLFGTRGGHSFYGSGGVERTAVSATASLAGTAGTGFGAGGGGAIASTTGAAAAGGNGQNGAVIITEYG